MDPRERPWWRECERWVTALPGFAPARAGLVGGLAMAAYLVVAMWARGGDPLSAVRAIGAGHPLGGGVLTGTMMHFVTAAFWGLRLGDLLRHAPPRFHRARAAIPIGVLWGVALWLVMGMIIGPLFSPAIARTDLGHYVAAHLVYGVTSAVVLARSLRVEETESEHPPMIHRVEREARA